MASRAVLCPECGSTMAYGRLTCSACGALIASVAGGGTRQLTTVTSGDVAEPSEPTAAGDVATEEAPVLDAPAVDIPVGDFLPAEAEPPAAPGPAPRPPIAGAYLAPSATYSPPPAPAEPRARPAPPSVAPPRAPAPTDPASSPEGAGLLSDLPLVAPAGLAGWIVAAGAAATIAGYLLPWGPTGTIRGGSLDSSFFGRWGLSNPANILVLGLAGVTLALQIVPSRVPAWLATGALGLVFGGVLGGVAWTYLTGPFELGSGGSLVALGAILLVGGGLAQLRPQRH